MHKYRPLSVRNEFRLLELLSGQPSEDICCMLTHESLFEHRPYFAVSYTWGSPELNRGVKLDGISVPVRENLYQLLQHLRQPHSSLVLWIDALCIDQSSIREKNIQVPLMGQIYSRATSVFVSLGLHADESELYFDPLPGPLPALDGPQTDPTPQTSTTSVGILTTQDRATHLYSRPYWSRTWIVQEIVLASNLTVFCGDRSCAWSTFVTGPSGHSQRSPLDPAAPDYAFVNTVALRQAGTMTKLRRLLFRFHMTYCFDPRDLVYSLLNFAEDTRNGDHGIVVDYSCTIEALFVQTLAFCSGIGCRAMVSGQVAVECLRFCDTLATRLGAKLEPSIDYAEDTLWSGSIPGLTERLTCRSYFVSVKRFARINGTPGLAESISVSHQTPTQYQARSIPAKEPLSLWSFNLSLQPSDVIYAVDFDSPNEPSYQLCCVSKATCVDTDEDGVKYYRYNIIGLGVVSNQNSDISDSSAQQHKVQGLCAFLDKRLRSLEGLKVSDSLPGYILELTLQELVGICQFARSTAVYLPWALSKASTVDHWQEPRDFGTIW
ncbi:heterokaryon incompatibility protein-domain-containing protein [Xylaria telfairii]|nr:heterokaryon incompatibility protein-domain-containing protein [Xylaria telfairii]